MRYRLVLAAAVAAFGPLALAGAEVTRAEVTPAQPASPQPTLPQQDAGALPLNSSILGGPSGTAGGKAQHALTVRKHAERRYRLAHHLVRHRSFRVPVDLERPALAGVTLVQPIPHPLQPPHATVPVPAYPLENFATFYTAPPPPVVCHPARFDPDAPNPHLYRERPVICEADNP